jgi:hypothetical protein
MWPWVRSIFLVLSLLALPGGNAFSQAAMSGMPAPCAHDHGEAADDATGPGHGNPTHAPQTQHGSTCLACCLAACAAMPGLPLRPAMEPAVFAASPTGYWDNAGHMIGRAIPPDLGPPRTTA